MPLAFDAAKVQQISFPPTLFAKFFLFFFKMPENPNKTVLLQTLCVIANAVKQSRPTFFGLLPPFLRNEDSQWRDAFHQYLLQ